MATTNTEILNELGRMRELVSGEQSAVLDLVMKHDTILRGDPNGNDPGLQEIVRDLAKSVADMSKVVSEHNRILLGDKDHNGILHDIRDLRTKNNRISNLLWTILGSAVTFGATILIEFLIRN